jgi:branched-chain amino acid transport system permease protein
MNRYWTYFLSAAGLAVLIAIGLFAGPFILYLGMRVMILAIFAIGYNLLLGRTGLLSFGHAAFYATGAYGLALTTIHLNPHPLLGIFSVWCGGIAGTDHWLFLRASH